MVKAKDVGTIFLLVTEWESQQLAIASTQLCIIMSFDFFKAVLPFSVFLFSYLLPRSPGLTLAYGGRSLVRLVVGNPRKILPEI